MKNRRDRYSQQKYIKRNRVLKDENCFQRILQKSTDGKQSNINEAEVKLIFIGTGTHKISNCLYNKLQSIFFTYFFISKSRTKIFLFQMAKYYPGIKDKW